MAKRIALIVIALSLFCTGYVQAQTDPCPGFRNPVSFSTGSNLFFWSARVGERVNPSSSNADTTTGYHIMSTCASSNCPDITGHANITNANYNSGNDGGITCCNDGNLWDANGRRFQIITSENAGTDQFTINNGVGMPRIPPGYSTSIRLGDPRANGSSSGSAYGTWSIAKSNKGSEALFYTMRVSADNALLVFNYAVVGRCYSHSPREAGEFIIRIVLQEETEHPDGSVTYSWPNTPINDSLWFKVSAPAIPTAGAPPAPWVMGRPGSTCGSTTCAYVYKPWAKVAISLSRYKYRTVRIEMYTSDCIYDVDPVYAYICGDYAPMKISSLGCADAASSAIDTLSAPEGLLTYTWYAALRGMEQEIFNDDHMDTVSFRQVSETSTDNRYIPTISDFVVTAGPNTGDTLPEQTFMCVMTSALDPAKPIVSKVYANVENGKPSPYVGVSSDCDLNVHLDNRSLTYGNYTLDTDSTRWVIYSDTLNTSVLDTLWGENVSYRFPTDGYYNVTMRVKVFGKDCGSERTVVCRAMQGHESPIVLSESILCDGETMVAYCAENCDQEKVWKIGANDSIVRGVDTITWIPPIGVSTLSLTTTVDSLCPATTTASVKVLGKSTVTSDVDASIICAGDSVTLSAAGLDDPRWSSVPYDSSLAGQQGRDVVVVKPKVTTTYSVRPAQDSRCVQNASDITILVLQYPEPDIATSKPYVDLTNPSLSLEDRSANSTSSFWTFSDGTTATGNRVDHEFGVGGDSVTIALRACNEERCCSDTSLTLPVRVNAIWVPNAFTPDGTSNRTFRFVFTLPIMKFEIWIYNRNGQLVYHSDDTLFQWDGRTLSGDDCPQGAYVYFYRCTYEMEPDRNYTGDGTVLLLR